MPSLLLYALVIIIIIITLIIYRVNYFRMMEIFVVIYRRSYVTIMSCTNI